MGRDWNNIDQSGSQQQSNNSHQQRQKQNNNHQQIKQQNIQNQQKKQHHQSINETNIKQNKQIRQKPKYLSDNELIEKIKCKQIQQRKKIKIVRCFSEELIQTIKNHKLVSYFKQIKLGDKPPFYILSFRTQQDLISFIQQKINNKYKFFLQPYIKTAKDIEREKQRQQRKKNQQNKYNNNKYQRKNQRNSYNQDKYYQKNNRRNYQNNQRGEKQRQRQRQKQRQRIQPAEKYKKQIKNRNRPQYQEEYNKRQKQTQQPKRNRNRPQYEQDQKQDYKNRRQPQRMHQKIKQSKHQFNFQFNQNLITIKDNIYSKNRIADQIVSRKIPSKYNRIKILVKAEGLDKVIQLIEIIYQKIGYGLKSLPDQQSKNQFIQVILQQKCHLIHPNLQYRLLGSNCKKYFQDIKIKNKFRISKEFSIEQYIKGFKQNQKEICKKWNQIIIKAQAQNIPQLLKLSWKLKKQFYLSINIKVGERNQIPWTVLHINPETDKDKRPKVDTSFVNSYLTN